jgi:HK97 family phage major capsid protein
MCYEKNTSEPRGENRRTIMLPSRPSLRSAEDWIAEAQNIVASTDARTFNLQAQSRVEACLKMAELARAGKGPDDFGKKHDFVSIAERAIRRNAELRTDPAALAFFNGKNVDVPMTSDFGTRLAQRDAHVQGRAVGKVLQMHNLNLAPEEKRTYTALNETTSSAGGSSVPIDFFAEVIQQMREVDELFAAARWITTPNGRPLDIPLADDTEDNNIAKIVSENAAWSGDPVNPTFAQLQFGNAPLWSTGRLKLSLQLVQDSPVIYEYLRDTFARRFARGMGAAFITTLLSAVTNFSAAGTGAITPEDLFGVMNAVDPAYSVQGGWLMNWSTWLAIRKLKSTSRYFVGEIARRDATGRLTLLDRPVFITPSLADIGAGNQPIVYGDLKRFIIRTVYAEQTVNKYSEAFMPTGQVGFEGVFRADSSLAVASATDYPCKAVHSPLS